MSILELHLYYRKTETGFNTTPEKLAFWLTDFILFNIKLTAIASKTGGPLHGSPF